MLPKVISPHSTVPQRFVLQSGQASSKCSSGSKLMSITLFNILENAELTIQSKEVGEFLIALKTTGNQTFA